MRLRETSQLTQAELAESIGVNLRTYQKYEYMQAEPSLEKIGLIAHSLNVEVEDLFKDGTRPASELTEREHSQILGSIIIFLSSLNNSQLANVLRLVSGYSASLTLDRQRDVKKIKG